MRDELVMRQIHYVSNDGVWLAYQMIGDGPRDLVFSLGRGTGFSGLIATYSEPRLVAKSQMTLAI